MDQAARDARAEKAVTAIATKLLGRENIRKIFVKAVDDYAGEPALYVNIHLKRGDELPSIEQRSKLRDALREELGRLEDNRFPYLSIVGSYRDAVATAG